jgi:uncharacterized membrane-anchored protein YitT (DUF2179 family)
MDLFWSRGKDIENSSGMLSEYGIWCFLAFVMGLWKAKGFSILNLFVNQSVIHIFQAGFDSLKADIIFT